VWRVHPWPILAARCQRVHKLSRGELQCEEWQWKLQPMREGDVLYGCLECVPGMPARPVRSRQHVFLFELRAWNLQRAVFEWELQRVPAGEVLAHHRQRVHGLCGGDLYE